MFNNNDLIEMFNQEKKRKHKRIQIKQKYIRDKYNNFNRNPKPLRQIIKNSNFVSLSDNLINQINQNLKLSDNLKKNNRNIGNMFYKTPYFATRELDISNKLRKFFDLYSNQKMDPKINLKKKKKELERKKKKDQKRQNDLIEKLLRKQHENHQKKLEKIERKLSLLLSKENNPKIIYKTRKASKKLLPMPPSIHSEYDNFHTLQTENKKKENYKKIFKKSPPSPKLSLIAKSESITYPTSSNLQKSEKTKFYLSLKLGSLENISNLSKLKGMDTKYAPLVIKTPTSSFNNDILTFSSRNSLVNNFRKSMFKMKVTKQPGDKDEKIKGVLERKKIDKEELKKIFRKVLIVVRFVMRIRFFIKMKRIVKVEGFKESYNVVSRDFLKGFVGYVKRNVLLKVWDDEENFFFLKNGAFVGDMRNNYGVDFKCNEDQRVLKVIANLVNDFFKLLLKDKILNKLKRSFNTLFVGKQCVFPQGFFYDFEHNFFKMSYFGFFDIMDKKKSIFLLFSLIIVKIFLKIISHPGKHIANFNDFPKKKHIILTNTLIFCSIFQNIFFDTIKKHFCFKKIEKDSFLESVKIIEKKQLKIIETYKKSETEEDIEDKIKKEIIDEKIKNPNVIENLEKTISDENIKNENSDEKKKKQNSTEKIKNPNMIENLEKTISDENIKNENSNEKIKKQNSTEKIKNLDIIEKPKHINSTNKINEINKIKKSNEENGEENIYKNNDVEKLKKVKIMIPKKKKKYSIFYDSIEKKHLKLFFENKECVGIYEHTINKVIRKFEAFF